MILYACIVRLQDGLPLSASTDFHLNKQVLECKRWLRRLCVSLCQRPARGTAMVCDHSIHFRSAGDVSSLTICSSSFPVAAAFSFLEELIWEFSSSYNSTAIALASRPYTFLEFDRVIQRVKHNYNYGASPPIHLDRGTTPVTVQLEEVAELNGVANGHTAAQVSPANHRMGSVSPLGILSLTLNIMCAALNLIRGVHLAENSFQCYLYLFYCPSRTLKSWGLLLGIGLCNLHLYGLRSLWQIGFHVFVAFLSAVQIVSRRPLDRHSDCGV
ncbi:vesicle-trafficking protein SEC22c isoform X2 [Bufo gargarizans]|uniref:vesicle-trafficking protein SEC22c isoform X2 n=1 Tax=Bufo gargarizans TaxID=30331 RepID=UPI001CF248FF|nr:vesicle-trafficking protein SEC22c isoform X2 [Bufo gargarizans]